MKNIKLLLGFFLIIFIISGCSKNNQIINENFDIVGNIYEVKFNDIKFTEKNILDVNEQRLVDVSKNQITKYVDINKVIKNLDYDTVYRVKDTEQYFYKVKYDTRVIVSDNFNFYEMSNFNDSEYIISLDLSNEIVLVDYYGELAEKNIKETIKNDGRDGSLYYGLLNDSSINAPNYSVRGNHTLNIFKEYMEQNNLNLNEFVNLFNLDNIYSLLFNYKVLMINLFM